MIQGIYNFNGEMVTIQWTFPEQLTDMVFITSTGSDGHQYKGMCRLSEDGTKYERVEAVTAL